MNIPKEWSFKHLCVYKWCIAQDEEGLWKISSTSISLLLKQPLKERAASRASTFLDGGSGRQLPHPLQPPSAKLSALLQVPRTQRLTQTASGCFKRI